MRLKFIALILFISPVILAQTTADFESFALPQNTFLNGSDGSMGFEDGNISLLNDYNSNWNSWSGWAISNTTDTSTPGPSNQYSSISGSGANGSQTYATSFVIGESLLFTTGDHAGGFINGFYINNATYPYLSMTEGDDFAKKFGGENGTDPDFFYVSIKPYGNSNTNNDSLIFYLADYRSDDSSEDYIVKEWTYLSLEQFDEIDTLSFSLYSSDVGMFGMNTPAYFCIDEITTNDKKFVDGLEELANATVSIYPNPCNDKIHVEYSKEIQSIRLYDISGNFTALPVMQSQNETIDLSLLMPGNYVLESIFMDGSIDHQRLMKL